MENIRRNNFDEALRLIWFDSADIDESLVSDILNTNYHLQMSSDLQAEMMIQLEYHLLNKSFGNLLSEQMIVQSINVNNLTDLTKIPNTLIEDILEDRILTNNIPVFFVKTLLKILNVQFKDAQKAILRTFEIIKSSQFGMNEGFAMTQQPSFRKQGSVNRTLNDWTTLNSDNRELFENKDALNKYLLRLNDLMDKE
jgi:hypothetical protein